MMSYVKKIQFAILLCIGTAAYCGGMANVAEMQSDYDGLYLGADITLGDFNANVTTSYPSASVSLSAINISGGALIGYDMTIYDRFKMGIEFLANANAYNASSSFFSDNTKLTARQQYNLAPQILPGFLFYPGVVGHLILGYSNAYISVEDNGQHGYINRSGNQSGFRGGLGMKVDLFGGFSFRGDIVYSVYGNLHGNGGTNNNLYDYQNYSVGVQTLEGTATIIYKFSDLSF